MSEQDFAERVEDALAEAHRTTARSRRMSVELNDLHGRARSPIGIEATVDRRGAVHDVVLSPDALEMTSDALSIAVMRAISAAQDDLRTRAAEITEKLPTEEPPLGAHGHPFDQAEHLMSGAQ